MKLFDKNSERKVWIAILFSIPILFYIQWKYNGSIGLTQIIIIGITLLIAIGLLYIIKWYSNKN